MRHAVFSLLPVLLVLSMVGCCSPHGCFAPAAGTEGCHCGMAQGPIRRSLRGLHTALATHCHPQPVEAGGPPVGTVTYPYYTVRGPRDFLADNPPSIGR
jgi:hypothetical protein